MRKDLEAPQSMTNPKCHLPSCNSMLTTYSVSMNPLMKIHNMLQKIVTLPIERREVSLGRHNQLFYTSPTCLQPWLVAIAVTLWINWKWHQLKPVQLHRQQNHWKIANQDWQAELKEAYLMKVDEPVHHISITVGDKNDILQKQPHMRNLGWRGFVQSRSIGRKVPIREKYGRDLVKHLLHCKRDVIDFGECMTWQ